MNVCLLDLAKFTGGLLRMAAMPPRDGGLTLIRRVVLSPELAQAGDVYWRLAPEPGDADAAFLRGALGVVTAGTIEPWPGCFSLQVAEPAFALNEFVTTLVGLGEEFFDDRPELKVLQLCAARRADISSPTCGRSANGRMPDRCRRQAA